MRTLTIALASATLLAAPAAGQTSRSDVQTLRQAAPDRCTPTAGIVGYPAKRPPSMKLGDQPPATQFYAVYNVVDGCPQPVVVRKGIGGNWRDPAPIVRTPPRVTRAQQ